MNTTFDNMIIETSVLDLANSNSQYNSRIAKLVLQEMDKKAYKKDATPDILYALYRATLRNARVNQFERQQADEAGIEFKPEFYDISFYSFIQKVMDKVCWSARRGYNARLSVDEWDLELGSTGIDFANDMEPELGINTTDKEAIRQDVMEANRRLFNVSSRLAQHRGLSLNNATPLFMFAPSTLVDGQWVTEVQTNDWDEAMSAMDHIAEQLKLSEQVTDADLNAAIDFAE